MIALCILNVGLTNDYVLGLGMKNYLLSTSLLVGMWCMSKIDTIEIIYTNLILATSNVFGLYDLK